MISSVRTVISRAIVPAAVAVAVAMPLTLPSQAHAWWRGGVWIGLPPVVVSPPYYAAPRVVYAPPLYAPGYGYGHRRAWVPARSWRGRWAPY